MVEGALQGRKEGRRDIKDVKIGRKEDEGRKQGKKVKKRTRMKEGKQRVIEEGKRERGGRGGFEFI